jgi:hypothetical protein
MAVSNGSSSASPAAVAALEEVRADGITTAHQ